MSAVLRMAAFCSLPRTYHPKSESWKNCCIWDLTYRKHWELELPTSQRYHEIGPQVTRQKDLEGRRQTEEPAMKRNSKRKKG